MGANHGLRWNGEDLTECIAQGAHLLRRAMLSGQHCDVPMLVDAGLLEALWCPRRCRSSHSWLRKDIIRRDLAALHAIGHREYGTVTEQLEHAHCKFRRDARCSECDAGSVLAHALLGPMDWFFECDPKGANEDDILWIVAKFYDQVSGLHFYRTLSSMDRHDKQYRVGQMLFRIPEADYDWFTRYIADLSTLLIRAERSREIDYCLVCSSTLDNDKKEALEKSIDVHVASAVMAAVRDYHGDSDGLVRALYALAYTQDTTEELSKYPLSQTTKQRIATERQRPSDHRKTHMDMGAYNDLANLYLDESLAVQELLSRAKSAFEAYFFTSDDDLIKRAPAIDAPLRIFVADVVARITDTPADLRDQSSTVLGVAFWKLANYFIWLSCLHPNLASYTVRYASNYRLLPPNVKKRGRAHSVVQNPCFVIASRALPSTKLVSAARVSLTHILSPIEDHYAERMIALRGEQDGIALVEERLGHEVIKAYRPAYRFIKDDPELGAGFARAAILYGILSTPGKEALSIVSDDMSEGVAIVLAWRVHLLRDIFSKSLVPAHLNNATIRESVQYLWNYPVADHVQGNITTVWGTLEPGIAVRIIQLQFILLINAMKHYFKQYTLSLSNGGRPVSQDGVTEAMALANALKTAANVLVNATPLTISVKRCEDAKMTSVAYITVANKSSECDFHSKWKWHRGTPQASDIACRVIWEYLKYPYVREDAITLKYDRTTGHAVVTCKVPLCESRLSE